MVKTYDPKKVTVIVGNHIVTGFAENDMIKIKPNGDGFGLYSGADGEVARAIDPNQTFKVTLSLARTSKTNDFLSQLHNLDRQTGAGIVPIVIKDLGGTMNFIAAEAWITNYPEVGRGRSIDTQDWEFDTGRVETPIYGGND